MKLEPGSMVLCARCNTWCYDLVEHQDGGECELIQRLRASEAEVRVEEKLRGEIEDLENEISALQDKVEELEQEHEAKPRPILTHPLTSLQRMVP